MLEISNGFARTLRGTWINLKDINRFWVTQLCNRDEWVIRAGERELFNEGSDAAFFKMSAPFSSEQEAQKALDCIFRTKEKIR